MRLYTKEDGDKLKFQKAFCPSNATKKIKEIPGIILLNKASGKRAVRELVMNTFLIQTLNRNNKNLGF